MLKNVVDYLKPTSVKEVCEKLTSKELYYTILAGGTSLILNNPTKKIGIVDIKGLKLNYIKSSKKSISIGAATTINELLDSSIIKNYCNGIIFKSAYNISSTPLRNLITVGGNIVQLYPWSDLPLALLIAEAKVKLVGKTKNRTIKISNLFKKHPTIQLKKDEVLTEIILPENKGYKGSFKKFSKTSFDYSLIDVAVLLNVKKNIIEDAKIGISACGPLPQLLSKSSKLLVGKKITDKDVIKQLLLESINEAIFMKDKRVSVDYKKQILPVLIAREFNEQLFVQ
jgi:CO/xanthine dehydrogenase FAD-binding subunit